MYMDVRSRRRASSELKILLLLLGCLLLVSHGDSCQLGLERLDLVLELADLRRRQLVGIAISREMSNLAADATRSCLGLL